MQGIKDISLNCMCAMSSGLWVTCIARPAEAATGNWMQQVLIWLKQADTWCSAKLLNDHSTCTNCWTKCQRLKAPHHWSSTRKIEKELQSPCHWQISFCWPQPWRDNQRAHCVQLNWNERKTAQIQNTVGAADCRTGHVKAAVWKEQHQGKSPRQRNTCYSEGICCSQKGHAQHHAGRIETGLGQKTGLG